MRSVEDLRKEALINFYGHNKLSREYAIREKKNLGIPKRIEPEYVQEIVDCEVKKLQVSSRRRSTGKLGILGRPNTAPVISDHRFIKMLQEGNSGDKEYSYKIQDNLSNRNLSYIGENLQSLHLQVIIARRFR